MFEIPALHIRMNVFNATENNYQSFIKFKSIAMYISYKDEKGDHLRYRFHSIINGGNYYFDVSFHNNKFKTHFEYDAITINGDRFTLSLTGLIVVAEVRYLKILVSRHAIELKGKEGVLYL